MIDNFSDSQVIRKNVVARRGGVVAAQHRRAAEVGAKVLEAGSDAVDAAVATSFAVGCMMLRRAAAEQRRVDPKGECRILPCRET